MSRRKPVIKDAEFKLVAVKRMMDCSNVKALAQELGVGRYALYRWLDAYRDGGLEALRGPGPKRGRRAPKPPTSTGASEAEGRIIELERKIAQQQLELDFFRRALRQVEALEQNAGRGKPRSTGSSK